MVEPHKIFGRLGNQMFQGAYLYSQMKKGLIPDVYIQDPSYFEDCKEEIKQLYGQNIPSRTKKVAIHVRRGDYVNNPFYVDLTETDYYEKAMAEFPQAEFLIFSDDIEWCKKQNVVKDCEFSEGKTELEDMNLMASCVGHIIANSSFSWWAAYISPYTQKVVAPKAWYLDKENRTKIPETWIRL